MFGFIRNFLVGYRIVRIHHGMSINSAARMASLYFLKQRNGIAKKTEVDKFIKDFNNKGLGCLICLYSSEYKQWVLKLNS